MWRKTPANRALETPKTDRMLFIQLEIAKEAVALPGVFYPFARFSAIEAEFSGHAIALRWKPFGTGGDCQYPSTDGHLV